MKKILILMCFIFLTACGGGSGSTNSNSSGEQAMPVGALLNEYEKSKDATKAKYTGKTLTVKGYSTTAPILPTGADDDGVLVIMEKGGDMLKTLTCWFSAADKADFSKLSGNEMVTIRGVFNDELSTGLKSCKLVKTE